MRVTMARMLSLHIFTPSQHVSRTQVFNAGSAGVRFGRGLSLTFRAWIGKRYLLTRSYLFRFGVFGGSLYLGFGYGNGKISRLEPDWNRMVS